MSHLILLPVVLPAVMGALITLWMRGDLLLQRVFSIAATATLLLGALALNWQAAGGEIQVYRMGNWAAPFGIVLMLDRLAAIMLALTALLALVVQLYAIGSGWDRRGRHFHALWQFQLMGLCGAFLTGDAFNLFVFFEVMLIASYGLMIHAGGAMRLRAGVQYIAYNITGSALFLAALGTIYAATGTLNMADIALRVASMPAGDTALVQVGAVLLIIVFAIKAALVPLHFWLPATYANAPGPVAALFAIMTKVGVYGIIRFSALAFPAMTPIGDLLAQILLPAALLTLVLGQIGVLGAQNLGRMAAFAAIGSVGMLMVAVSQAHTQALAAAIWYMIHSTLAAGALFLIVDLIARLRGSDWLRPASGFTGIGLVSALYFGVAIAVSGLPPLSGFLGKLMIMQATQGAAQVVVIWSIILATSLIVIVGLMRAGMIALWKTDDHTVPSDIRPDGLSLTMIGVLLAALAGLTVFAGPISDYTAAAAAQLNDPAAYIEAVLYQQEGTR